MENCVAKSGHPPADCPSRSISGSLFALQVTNTPMRNLPAGGAHLFGARPGCPAHCMGTCALPCTLHTTNGRGLSSGYFFARVVAQILHVASSVQSHCPLHSPFGHPPLPRRCPVHCTAHCHYHATAAHGALGRTCCTLQTPFLPLQFLMFLCFLPTPQVTSSSSPISIMMKIVALSAAALVACTNAAALQENFGGQSCARVTVASVLAPFSQPFGYVPSVRLPQSVLRVSQ